MVDYWQRFKQSGRAGRRVRVDAARSYLPRRSVFDQKAQLGSALGWFAISGVIVGFAAGVVLPHPESFDETGLIGVQLVTVTIGVYVLVARNRVPNWLLRLGVPIAVALTTAALWFSGDSTSAFALFYLWTGLFALSFFTVKEGALAVCISVGTYWRDPGGSVRPI